jgi:hypothetical protein
VLVVRSVKAAHTSSTTPSGLVAVPAALSSASQDPARVVIVILAFGSGLVMSLGNTWGLVRHPG